MALRYGLVAVILAFLASSVLAYYPYGPEYRIYGTETTLPSYTYPVAYTNYYPETYNVYSGDYASYTGTYYRPTYSALDYYPYYYGSYYRPYYYRDYPFATSFATYNTTPTSYVATNPYYSGYNYAISSPYYSGYNYAVGYNSPSFSISYSNYDGYSIYGTYGGYYGSYYGGSNGVYDSCTESWCVRMN